MRPQSSGHVDVGALELYHEHHGHGPPLVLLHGAFGTIESCFADLLPALAGDFEVLAVELQGHGRTRDIARPLSYEQMAADVAALLEALEIPRAHVVGYSMGGAVGLQLALDHPELVDRLVFAGGADFDPSGVYPEAMADFESFDPHQLDGSRWHRGVPPSCARPGRVDIARPEAEPARPLRPLVAERTAREAAGRNPADQR
jgi:pimeloyl-ACP methyl ester carboxylesterase